MCVTIEWNKPCSNEFSPCVVMFTRILHHCNWEPWHIDTLIQQYENSQRSRAGTGKSSNREIILQSSWEGKRRQLLALVQSISPAYRLFSSPVHSRKKHVAGRKKEWLSRIIQPEEKKFCFLWPTGSIQCRDLSCSGLGLVPGLQQRTEVSPPLGWLQRRALLAQLPPLINPIKPDGFSFTWAKS